MTSKLVLNCSLCAALWFGCDTSSASAQTEIKGSGLIRETNGAKDGTTWYTHIAINAWVDEAGLAQGALTWNGGATWDLPPDGPPEYAGGPSDPWYIEVTGLYFSVENDGTTAYVYGIVVNSPNHIEDEGIMVALTLTDVFGGAGPDLIMGAPVDNGNFTIR